MSDDPRSEFARGNAIYAAIGAALLLYYGFGVGLVGTSGSAVYNVSVDVCTLAMKSGGVAMACIAAACMAGIAKALLFDAVVAIGIGVVFALCGATWLLTTGDWEGLLFLVFGAMFISSGRQCWNAYRSGAGESHGFPVQPVEPVRPVHPAEVHPDVLPKPGEPPPAEGYLAALAREKKAAPRAEHE